MAREKYVRLSECEHEQLESYRQQEYGTEDLPYGVVIRDLVQLAQECDSR